MSSEPEFPELREGEGVISDVTESLWRNASPAWVDSTGQITSQLFKAMPKDGGQLSVAQSRLVDAETHYNDFTSLGLFSSGVYFISVGQVLDAAARKSAPVRCVDDNGLVEAPQAHAFIDYRAMTGSQPEKVAGLLKRAALANGIAFCPPST